MSKKIEDLFNLPSVVQEDDVHEIEQSEINLEEMSAVLTTVEKLDKALSQVTDLDSIDSDMDRYAKDAMDAFKDLMDLGHNVEDRHAASIFEAAGKMMNNAITAKTAKADKKLKMLELQMRKARLELDEKKLDIQLQKNSSEDEIEGKAQEFEDRNSLIDAVIQQIKNSGS